MVPAIHPGAMRETSQLPQLITANEIIDHPNILNVTIIADQILNGS
jgi:hypothetical protein